MTDSPKKEIDLWSRPAASPAEKLPTRLRTHIEEPRSSTSPYEIMLKQWLSKTILRSRTILTAVLGILGILLTKLAGLEKIDFESVVDMANGLQGSEIIAIAALTLAAVFRKFLKTDLSTPGLGGANSASNG